MLSKREMVNYSMELKKIYSASILALTAMASLLSYIPPAYSEKSGMILDEAEFYCKQSPELSFPITAVRYVYQGKEIDQSLIQWTTTQGNYSPLERCKEVSRRFNRLKDDEALRYVKHGFQNGEPVICGVKRDNQECGLGYNLLLTLRRGEKGSKELPKLFEILGNAFSSDVYKRGKAVDLEQLLYNRAQTLNSGY